MKKYNFLQMLQIVQYCIFFPSLQKSLTEDRPLISGKKIAFFTIGILAVSAVVRMGRGAGGRGRWGRGEERRGRERGALYSTHTHTVEASRAKLMSHMCN